MKLVGVTELPLHHGKAPRWLFERMVKLGKCIVEVIIYEYGNDEFLRRVSNPFWFQAFSCVLGWDFHSSGATTVTMGALKMALKPEETGIAITGGKGKISRRTPEEIRKIGNMFSLSSHKIENLLYSSRMAAKVDNTLIQAGYPLYHHSFVFKEDGKWSVIQQGLSIEDQTARRYHWLSDHVKSFVVEPHDAIVGDRFKENVLDMTAKESEDCRKVSTDLVKDGPERIKKDLLSLRPHYQKELREFFGQRGKEFFIDVLKMPRKVNWKALERAYDFQPKNYEELIGIQGIGPSTARGLALVSEIIYGEPPSWKDPCKYSFCVGGKDGLPHPIDVKTYSEISQFMGDVIKELDIEKKEKIEALRRLGDFLRSVEIKQKSL
ncbi:MAG: DUF763 domain-containing protein [Candidatus Aenigmarchaeota archaeon]|nr:DUF763 domain-containing protein [Candidatus Aenigmarchaeota archaeon]